MHDCPNCGSACACDGEDHYQPAPNDCAHACDDDVDDDWEEVNTMGDTDTEKGPEQPAGTTAGETTGGEQPAETTGSETTEQKSE